MGGVAGWPSLATQWVRGCERELCIGQPPPDCGPPLARPCAAAPRCRVRERESAPCLPRQGVSRGASTAALRSCPYPQCLRVTNAHACHAAAPSRTQPPAGAARAKLARFSLRHQRVCDFTLHAPLASLDRGMRCWPRQPPLRVAVSVALVLLARRYGAAASGSAAAGTANCCNAQRHRRRHLRLAHLRPLAGRAAAVVRCRRGQVAAPRFWQPIPALPNRAWGHLTE